MEASDNVFLENLHSTRNLETTYYVTDMTQASDFYWIRESGLQVNIGILNVNVIPEFTDTDHDSDNKYMLGNPNNSEDKNKFNKIVQNYCRWVRTLIKSSGEAKTARKRNPPWVDDLPFHAHRLHQNRSLPPKKDTCKLQSPSNGSLSPKLGFFLDVINTEVDKSAGCAEALNLSHSFSRVLRPHCFALSEFLFNSWTWQVVGPDSHVLYCKLGIFRQTIIFSVQVTSRDWQASPGLAHLNMKPRVRFPICASAAARST